MHRRAKAMAPPTGVKLLKAVYFTLTKRIAMRPQLANSTRHYGPDIDFLYMT